MSISSTWLHRVPIRRAAALTATIPASSRFALALNSGVGLSAVYFRNNPIAKLLKLNCAGRYNGVAVNEPRMEVLMRLSHVNTRIADFHGGGSKKVSSLVFERNANGSVYMRTTAFLPTFLFAFTVHRRA